MNTTHVGQNTNTNKTHMLQHKARTAKQKTARAPWGPKAAQWGQRKAQRKGLKERGPYSLMDHQWIHWWKSIDIHWWKSIVIHWWCPTMNTDGFPVLWIPVLWKNHENQLKNNEKPWKTIKNHDIRLRNPVAYLLSSLSQARSWEFKASTVLW